MSGTSLDSVDYALCEVSGERITLRAHWQVKFPASLHRRLHLAAQGAAHSYELAQLHHDLGRFYAQHAAPSSPRLSPALVGLHGQTVFHQPEGRHPATFQLGEPAYLVERLGVPVVGNFRAADLAAGGQGAPLATSFHLAVFAQRGRHVCVNNLGGISNVTSLDWMCGRAPRVLAFDTGPGNLPLDLAMRHLTAGRQSMDKDGRWAGCGRASEVLLAGWLKHPFFSRFPPKSTGRELFGEPFLRIVLSEAKRRRLSPFDLMATLTELTARSLALNYRLHLASLPERVVLAGGGAANPVLFAAIRRALLALRPEIEVLSSEALGWPLQSIEPAAFAWLACLRMQKRAGNLPETTGARRAALLGQVAEP